MCTFTKTQTVASFTSEANVAENDTSDVTLPTPVCVSSATQCILGNVLHAMNIAIW